MYIPVIGKIQYFYSVLIIHAYIAVGILNYGAVFTFGRLFHYPIEMLAFCIPIATNQLKKCECIFDKVQLMFLSMLGLVLLLIAAYIENLLR